MRDHHLRPDRSHHHRRVSYLQSSKVGGARGGGGRSCSNVIALALSAHIRTLTYAATLMLPQQRARDYRAVV